MGAAKGRGPGPVLAVLLAALLVAGTAGAQELVRFPSADPAESVVLDGYLFRPAEDGKRHPAVVFLHGCGGLFNRHGRIMARETAWAGILNRAGYLVLAVDSFGPRHQSQQCASGDALRVGPDRERPGDAYGALRFLRQLPGVDPARIGLMGWSQGGGSVLFTIAAARAVPSGGPDFRAAVAFYPGSCRVRRLPGWAPRLPLLVLIGDQDVWTPLPPCREVLDQARDQGAQVDLQVYPGAVHDFDHPDLPLTRHPEWGNAKMTPVVGTDLAARADALRRVVDFLDRRLAP